MKFEIRIYLKKSPGLKYFGKRTITGSAIENPFGIGFMIKSIIENRLKILEMDTSSKK